ncbi:MAG: Gfo/Idh/MocA family oxidoreductase [Rhizomicrobium sp.]
MKRIQVGIVGVGKIARDQHVPALAADPSFEIAACVTRHEGIDGVPAFATIGDMLDAMPALDAVAICTPPQTHFAMALYALERGKHVLLEKPPCETMGQFDMLVRAAAAAQRTLFQTWHARYAAGVAPARRRLAERRVTGGRIVWKEDVRLWHPGQTWLWQPGGFGVFDPGINALSILSHILPMAVLIESANLYVPANCQAPIAADLTLVTTDGARIAAELDFRHAGTQTWNIEIETDHGPLTLSEGGSALSPAATQLATIGEYPALYRRFAQLIHEGASDVDGIPFQLVSDAVLVGRRVEVEPFHP